MLRMNWKSAHLPFQQTGYFSKIIIDYLNKSDVLKPFYKHDVSIDGIKAAMHDREHFATNRNVLVSSLKNQYKQIETTDTVKNNIDKLLSANTFTITTAHQPAIFTGTLYFIYKILHVIKLADYLNAALPGSQFVPVFYMGSEDADLDELGKIYLDNEKIIWDTKQTGAVGRMNTKGLDKIIQRIEGEFSGELFGKELIAMLKDAYLDSDNIQNATFKLINNLFAEYGLIVLIADDANLKKEMLPVFEDDLFHQTPSSIVAETIKNLSAHYKVQANPREINLFYLKDNLRGRIEKVKDKFIVHDSGITFTDAEIKKELQNFPERFSPNVILRGLYQETILPNIIFVGGGGETAYWLELKNLFQHYKVPFPLLVLRNSFLIIEKKWKEKLDKTGLSVTDIFSNEEMLINEMVKKESQHQLTLQKETGRLADYYKELEKVTNPIDITLSKHVESLQAKALKPLKELEKKLLKAEKRKFEDRGRQIHAVKNALFPLNGLQERIENFMPYYASYGKEFIEMLYKNSLHTEQQFIVVSEG
jgi:bacillithiol synthase